MRIVFRVVDHDVTGGGGAASLHHVFVRGVGGVGDDVTSFDASGVHRACIKGQRGLADALSTVDQVASASTFGVALHTCGGADAEAGDVQQFTTAKGSITTSFIDLGQLALVAEIGASDAVDDE